MITARSLAISTLSLILLLSSIDASQHRSRRRKRADCSNAVSMCSFVTCENGGQCVFDTTTADCFRCNCAAGYTGKLCDTAISVIPIECNPGCQNGGICINNVCACPADYVGTLCETRNYCLPTNPCSNGGKCLSTSTSFVCDCTGTGYIGTLCTEQIVTNPCLSAPCQNGGQCFWDGTTMTCACANGYIGTFCQIPSNPCTGLTCQNGGKCGLISANTYGCICEEGFTGTQCETSILANHACITMPTTVCLNGGTCAVDGTDYKCKCATGWTGRNCETSIAIMTACNPSPCGGHGICIEANAAGSTIAVCSCENDWTGKYCDVSMNGNCPAGYCLSGGVCRMNGNTAYCDCPALYTGARCETSLVTMITTMPTTQVTVPNVGSCVPNPCQNGGICNQIGSTFTCDCLAPWGGPLCQSIVTTTATTPQTVDICTPNPCRNGGSCNANGGSFHCTCTAPFFGILCEMVPVTTLPPVPITTPGTSATCIDQPCKNGGTCVPIGTSYSCFCGLNSIYTGKNCDSTAPMSANECPLDCAPAHCIFSGYASTPYACLWNGIMRPEGGTTA